MTDIRGDEYDTLKRCFAALWPLVLRVPKNLKPENFPMAVLEAREKTSPRSAAKGLGMALNDIIEMSMSWPLSRVVEVDGQLSASGLITLSELRRRYSRTYKKIVKRGSIKSLDEYYLIKGIVDGNYSDEAEIHHLANLLEEFEESNSRGGEEL